MTNANRRLVELIEDLPVGELLYLHVHVPQIKNNPRPNLRREIAEQLISFHPFQADYESYVGLFEHFAKRMVENPETYSVVEWEHEKSRVEMVPVFETWGIMNYFVNLLPAQITTAGIIEDEKRIKIVTKDIDNMEWSPWRYLRSMFDISKGFNEGKEWCQEYQPFFTPEDVDKLKDRRWTEKTTLDKIWEDAGAVASKRTGGVHSEAIVSAIYSNGHTIPQETIERLQTSKTYYDRELQLIPANGNIHPNDVNFLTYRDYTLLELRQAFKGMGSYVDQFKR